jgi:glycosyltransferase involved in cell wall biosynthesis
LVIFTICASNYLAQAGVLGASLRAHHPDLCLTVFLLDDAPAHAAVPEHVRIVPAQTVFGRGEWNHRRCYYSTLEFATSVKPACFRHVFDQGASRAIYLDPDIRIFQPVDRFWTGEAGDAELVLTPHALSPLPDDGCGPADVDILRAGIYNLGFAAMRDTARIRFLLDWWDGKLRTQCLEDVRTGVFTDQKWMNHAPVLVPDTAVLRHVGYNAAYWNLHERTPCLRDGRWQIEGLAGETQDLVFFHFSGFDPARASISRHENRFGAQPPGDTCVLLQAYAKDLLDAGYEGFSALQAPSVQFADGTPWDPVCRALYREAVAAGLDLGDPLDEDRFLDWAAEAEAGQEVSRYQRTAGRHAGAVPAGSAQGSHVAYVGYLRSHLGVGEAGRNSLAALAGAGLDVCHYDVSRAAPAPAGEYRLAGRRWFTGQPEVTVLGCNADALPGVLALLPADLRHAYRIGCWYWETPEFPEAWSDRFAMVDEVWAATRFIADAIRARSSVPVVVMPPMVMPPAVPRDRAWLESTVPDVAGGEFVMLFQFDAASVPFRKNPEGVIAAFARAFTPDEPVRLVVKVLNAEAVPDLLAGLRAAAQGRRITLWTQTLASDERFRLLASVDAFVSLHRSEGFGLSIAEAMAYGLPVVVTGWSGNVDFTNDDNAAQVAFDLVRRARAHGPYPAGTLWAEPRLDDAARLMRRVWQDADWRAQIGRAAQATIAVRLSGDAIGQAMRARLEQVQALRHAPARKEALRHAPTRLTEPPRGPSLLRVVMRDMSQFPVYYMSRLPRLPALFWRLGLAGMLQRADQIARAGATGKGEFLLGRLFARIRQRFLGGR